MAIKWFSFLFIISHMQSICKLLLFNKYPIYGFSIWLLFTLCAEKARYIYKGITQALKWVLTDSGLGNGNGCERRTRKPKSGQWLVWNLLPTLLKLISYMNFKIFQRIFSRGKTLIYLSGPLGPKSSLQICNAPWTY